MIVRRIAVLSLFFAMMGCGNNSGDGTTASATNKINLVATISPLGDWIRNVGGEHVDVHCLVSGANNPHHFEPTTRDAVQTGSARALFAIGLELDPWAAKFARSAGTNIEFIEAGSWITPRVFSLPHHHDHHEADLEDRDDGHRHAEGGADPHFWHDPQRVITVVGRLAEELSRLDPPHAADYKANADKYISRLKELDTEVAALAGRIPKNTKLVTFHDAYSYLFERLGITLAAVFQTTPGIEPSLRDITEAVGIMKEIGQKVVFKEPGESATAADRVAQELNARIELLDPMDTETGVDPGGYIERFRGNLRRLEGALK